MVKNKVLGLFSEQTGKAVHQKIVKTITKYCIKNIFPEQYGQYLHKAVVEFSYSQL